jgi:competence protein ComEC
MFAWLAGRLIGALWRRSERLATLVPAQSAGRWGGLAAAAAYALLAGWAVPAQRTVAMIAAFVWLSGAGRRWPLHLILLAAAAAVALLDPWALLQPGFWLSFVAVALLAAASPSEAAQALGSPSGNSPRAAASLVGLGGRWRELARQPWAARTWAAARGGVRTQAVATVGLAPLTLLFFQQVSVVGFAANLAAIPLVTLLVTPLVLLGVLVPPLWSLAAWLLQALTGYLAWLAALPVAVWSAAAPPAWALAAGLAGGALAVLPLPWHMRALALPLMLPMLAPPVARPAPGQWEAVFVDVGQGNAVLVRTHRHLLVYDTGPMVTPESDAGTRVLVPLLRARGERQVDLLMLSHRDTDHVGGAASLLAAWPVRALASSLAPDHPLRAQAMPHRRCDAGLRWTWDGVDFEVLHPGADDHERAAGGATKSNALSCVLRVGPPAASRAGAGVLLLTGDIEAAQEAALVARHGDALASEVLLVPHHGSRTSSSAGFLDAVAPRVAVVQAAYRSRFGHPAPEVLARYAARGIEVVRSDRCGAWTRPPQGPGFCQREVARRYWHHPGTTEAAR